MRRPAVALLVALLSLVGLLGTATAAPAPAAKADATCPADRCRDHVVPAPPGVRVTSPLVRVLLPVGYATSRKRYPVVFMLNGALGDHTQWTRKTDLTSYSRTQEAIYVMPAGGSHRDAGWFTDWLDGSWQVESWHLGTVVPWVDRTFRTNGARGVVGASMGANGALTYAARHPGVFRTAASFSGWVDTQLLTPVSGNNANELGPADLRRVWGDQLLDADVWAAHNPTALAPKLRGVHVFVACGTGSVEPDTIITGSQGVHGGQREANLSLTHPGFLAALDAAGVEHTDLLYQGGVHDWPYFQDDLRWALPQMLELLT